MAPAAKPTSARQRNAASEGIALGLVALGHSRLRHDKIAVDLAFTAAWGSWAHSSRFSQVSTDLRNGSDGIWVMTHVDTALRARTVYWVVGDGELRITTEHSDWDPQDPDELAWAVSRIDDEVDLDGWIDLGQAFLDHFDPPRVEARPIETPASDRNSDGRSTPY